MIENVVLGPNAIKALKNNFYFNSKTLKTELLYGFSKPSDEYFPIHCLHSTAYRNAIFYGFVIILSLFSVFKSQII